MGRRRAEEVSRSLSKRVHFDRCRMTITFTAEDDEGQEDDYTIPAKFEVCGTCEGRGSVVNPSIDEHGISQEEFDEDPDFKEAYFCGRYDTQCPTCHGDNVELVPNTEGASAKEKRLIEMYVEMVQDEYDYATEREHERKMGY